LYNIYSARHAQSMAAYDAANRADRFPSLEKLGRGSQPRSEAGSKRYDAEWHDARRR